MALTLIVQRILFWSSVFVFMVFLGISMYAFALGVSDMMRFRNPDNLAFGIALVLLAFGGAPSFTVAWVTGKRLRQHRKQKTEMQNKLDMATPRKPYD